MISNKINSILSDILPFTEHKSVPINYGVPVAVSNVRDAVGKCCPYCDTPMFYPKTKRQKRASHPRRATVDHVFPKKDGVLLLDDGRVLVVVVCMTCNSEKGCLSPYRYIDTLAQRGDYKKAMRVANAFLSVDGVFPDGISIGHVIKLCHKAYPAMMKEMEAA